MQVVTIFTLYPQRRKHAPPLELSKNNLLPKVIMKKSIFNEDFIEEMGVVEEW